MLSGYTRFQFKDYRDKMEYQGDTNHLKCSNNNNRKSYKNAIPRKTLRAHVAVHYQH